MIQLLLREKKSLKKFRWFFGQNDDTQKTFWNYLTFDKYLYIFSVCFRYAPTRRKVADLIDARREKISSLIDSYAVYQNLTVKSSKALEFYEKLNTNVGDLQKKVSEAMEENEREKDAEIAKLAPPKPDRIYWNKLWNDFKG